VILEQAMSVNLSIKNAPDDVVERLRERAQRNHRSLQGELMAIIEEAVRPSSHLTPIEFLAEVRKLGLRSPSEAADMVRADRDHAHRDH
jgi:antitoxin FitA